MKQKTILLMMLLLAIAVGVGNAQTADSSAKSSETPLKIKKKPTVDGRNTNCIQSEGIISIRVTFDKSAKVTETEILKDSGCPAFDDNAVSAAKKITFVPATKDGEPVTVTKIIQYSRRRY